MPDEAIRWRAAGRNVISCAFRPTRPLARDLIFAAMKRGDLSSFGPVEDSVLRGDALLWLALRREAGGGVGIDAAAVTELHRTEWRKVCVVVACGAPSRRLAASRASASVTVG